MHCAGWLAGAQFGGVICNTTETHIAQRLYEVVRNCDKAKHAFIEVEAKVGLITVCLDGRTATPLKESAHGPLSGLVQNVKSETVVDFAQGWSFRSCVRNHAAFSAFNGLLNNVLESWARRTGASESPVMTFSRVVTRDETLRLAHASNDVRVRASYDEHDNLLAIVRKTRWADVNVLCPGTAHDVRVSVSVEEPLGLADIAGARVMETRVKERISYVTERLRYDLTIVTQKSSDDVCELEVEWLDAAALVAACEEKSRGDERALMAIVRELMENVRAFTGDEQRLPIVIVPSAASLKRPHDGDGERSDERVAKRPRAH